MYPALLQWHRARSRFILILPLLVHQLVSLILSELTIAKFWIASFFKFSKLWTLILSSDLQILLCLPRPDITMAADWFFVLASCPLLEYTYLDLVRWLLSLPRKRKFAFELCLFCLEIGKAFGAKRRDGLLCTFLFLIVVVVDEILVKGHDLSHF